MWWRRKVNENETQLSCFRRMMMKMTVVAVDKATEQNSTMTRTNHIALTHKPYQYLMSASSRNNSMSGVVCIVMAKVTEKRMTQINPMTTSLSA